MLYEFYLLKEQYLFIYLYITGKNIIKHFNPLILLSFDICLFFSLSFALLFVLHF